MSDIIKNLRRQLHQNPDLSGDEKDTAEIIKKFAGNYKRAEIIENLGGYGLAVVFSYSSVGPTVMIRCELDALPIDEVNTFDYRSDRAFVSHKCGHDGHMAIVSGLMPWLEEQKFKYGKVVLLYQPAEETGKGALALTGDDRFKALNPDYIFALHNIPGEPQNAIITTGDIFSATVQSISVLIKGKQCHASEPEKGINPALAIAEIIKEFSELNVTYEGNKDFALLTPVYINMGEKAYGISAGSGEVHYTVRTWTVETMKKLVDNMKAIIEETCKRFSLQFSVEWFDYFPSTAINGECTDLVMKSIEANNLTHINRPFPYKFGEDFGWYSQNYKVAMAGLGAGEESPALHHADYDFPDEITQTGINLFSGIISQILESY